MVKKDMDAVLHYSYIVKPYGHNGCSSEELKDDEEGIYQFATWHSTAGPALYFLSTTESTDEKLCKLIWPAARGRCTDETIRLLVHPLALPFPRVGSLTQLSINTE